MDENVARGFRLVALFGEVMRQLWSGAGSTSLQVGFEILPVNSLCFVFVVEGVISQLPDSAACSHGSLSIIDSQSRTLSPNEIFLP